MSAELAAWLRDQVDKDEWLAGSAHQFPCSQQVWHGAGTRPACDCGLPRRMAAEVEAKRQVIRFVVDADHVTTEDGYNLAPMDILRAMAMPYADREGFRPEWLTREQRDVIAAPGT